MNENFALVIDSTSKFSDVWFPYFGELNKFFPKEVKKYLVTDVCDVDLKTENLNNIYYNNSDSYREQFLGSLKQIEEEYMLYNSEDYILYNNVNFDEILALVDVLENDLLYDFIKLIKGPEKTTPYKTKHPHLHVIDKSRNFFAQQASIWRTKSFINVFENSKPNSGRRELEPNGSEVCRRIGINGLQHHTGAEKKRGRHHYDSIIFPCITTAVTVGKWNVTEYGGELNHIFNEYNIDPNIRGITK